MNRKIVGVIVALLVFGANLMFAGDASALCPSDCEMYWPPVTTYTDNNSIESQDLPIKYIVEWDGQVIATTENLSVPVPKPYGHDVPHTARVKAKTARGKEGEYSNPFPWSVPAIPAVVDDRGLGVR